MELPVGTRLRSAVDTTEVVVVRAPSESIDIRCGGQPMVPITQGVSGEGAIDPAHSSGTLVGKRYVDEALGIELLCTKGGDGSLAVGAASLLVKSAKPLPSSD